jgi:hypothetical protein
MASDDVRRRRGLEQHQAEGQHDRQRAHHGADELGLHRPRMEKAVDHRQQQAAAEAVMKPACATPASASALPCPNR